MEKLSHYIEAKILSLDGITPSRADISFATTKIMEMVHLNIADGHEVAVSFPDLVNRGGITTGGRVRIFGNPLSLAMLMARKDFSIAHAGGMFSLGKNPMKEVPSGCGWEIYSRVRSVERCTDAYAQRKSRYDAQKGFSAPEKQEKPSVSAGFKDVPFFKAVSKSTGDKRFCIFIKRTDVEGAGTGSLNSYGLGIAVPSF